MKKNLINVLKKLLIAFGGKTENIQNNATDIVYKIAETINKQNKKENN